MKVFQVFPGFQVFFVTKSCSYIWEASIQGPPFEHFKFFSSLLIYLKLFEYTILVRWCKVLLQTFSDAKIQRQDQRFATKQDRSAWESDFAQQIVMPVLNVSTGICVLYAKSFFGYEVTYMHIYATRMLSGFIVYLFIEGLWYDNVSHSICVLACILLPYSQLIIVFCH